MPPQQEHRKPSIAQYFQYSQLSRTVGLGLAPPRRARGRRGRSAAAAAAPRRSAAARGRRGGCGARCAAPASARSVRTVDRASASRAPCLQGFSIIHGVWPRCFSMCLTCPVSASMTATSDLSRGGEQHGRWILRYLDRHHVGEAAARAAASAPGAHGSSMSNTQISVPPSLCVPSPPACIGTYSRPSLRCIAPTCSAARPPMSLLRGTHERPRPARTPAAPRRSRPRAPHRGTTGTA